ncbi:MAG: large conductance mechanosensitive channel protein MscL [Dehalococcoidia bacterium]|nr:large conductance mechanosensitive channel protein MscL [Dehalococcoidia bacterium]
MLTGFRAFLFRGNVIDLAVAVVIGIAFGAVVDSVVSGLITPLIAMIVGESSLASLTFTINDAVFFYGSVIDQIISFVAVAAVIYFFVITPMNMFLERSRRGEVPADTTTKSCPECLSSVPVAARRCAFCTSELPLTA